MVDSLSKAIDFIIIIISILIIIGIFIYVYIEVLIVFKLSGIFLYHNLSARQGLRKES